MNTPRRAESYERLQAVRDNGDWEGWLAFFLRGVVEVSRESTSTAAAILRMREDYRACITTGLGLAAANGHRVMDRLFDHPIVNVATVSEWIGVKSAAANNLVNRLVEAGLLREITGPVTAGSGSILTCGCLKNQKRAELGE